MSGAMACEWRSEDTYGNWLSLSLLGHQGLDSAEFSGLMVSAFTCQALSLPTVSTLHTYSWLSLWLLQNHRNAYVLSGKENKDTKLGL